MSKSCDWVYIKIFSGPAFGTDCWLGDRKGVRPVKMSLDDLW